MVRLMLVLGLVLSLAACGGSRTDGLSKADEEALQARLDAAEDERAAAEADKVAAEADKVAAEADKVAAEADKVAAEADKVAAEADKVAAEAAQAVAEAAQAAAEADKAIAEADKAIAEADKAAAEAAQAAAEAAKVAAEADKVAAEAAKVAADEAKDRAEAEVQYQLGEAQAARQEAAAARQEAETARQDAATARGEADTAREEAAAAEREGARLAGETAKAQQEKLQADAADAFAGLDGTEITTPLTIIPKYRAPAGVSGAGTISETSGSSAGRWYVTTARSLDGNDIVRIYTDVGTPESVNIETEYSEFTIPEGKNYRVATITDITDYEDLITSSSFPTAGRNKDITLTIDSDTTDTETTKDTARFSGTFAGASGHFYCAATNPGTPGACNVHHDGDTGYTLMGGAWTFQTSSKTAKVKVPDTNYMHFGWWRRKGTGTFTYKTFNGDSAPVNNVSDVSGTAHYVGPAIGQYAIHQSYPGSPSNHGEFKATARLTANFGTTTMVYGSVTGFDVNPDWALTLKETAVTGGSVTDGGISWTIGGNTDDNDAAEGTWAGQFHNELETFGDQHPEGISGTFDASYESGAKLRGAYGAHLQ